MSRTPRCSWPGSLWQLWPLRPVCLAFVCQHEFECLGPPGAAGPDPSGNFGRFVRCAWPSSASTSLNVSDPQARPAYAAKVAKAAGSTGQSCQGCLPVTSPRIHPANLADVNSCLQVLRCLATPTCQSCQSCPSGGVRWGLGNLGSFVRYCFAAHGPHLMVQDSRNCP